MKTSISLLAQGVKRPFIGRTDVYNGFQSGSRTEARPTQLIQALAGAAPFDVTGGATLSDSMRDAAIARLERYRKNWNFYHGNHWLNAWEDGEEKAVCNFCKKIADAAVDWFVADGWKVKTVTGNEPVAEMLNDCWEYNGRRRLTEKAAQFGAITGDSFFYVTLETKNADGKDLPKEQHRVRVFAIDPANCFPTWNPLRPEEMLSVMIQFPMSQPDDASTEQLYTLVITKDKWTTYLNEVKKEENINPFGVVNVVHVPNLGLAHSSFGQGDFYHAISLNEEYNLALNSIRKVIKYHAEPTTLIFGAKAGDLDKGAKKVWSNLPMEAKVENLVLESDLTASFSYLDRLERQISELCCTPRIVFDPKELAMSHTSGLAMQMMFQPIIEKNRKRQVNWEKGISDANKLILKGHELLGYNLTELADKPEELYCTSTEFTSPLPRDEVSEMDMAQKKITAGVWSQAEAVRRLSGVNDSRRLALELAADKRAEIAIAAETARAEQGLQPNLAVVFLGSVMLSEDLEGLTKSIAELEQEGMNESAP